MKNCTWSCSIEPLIRIEFHLSEVACVPIHVEFAVRHIIDTALADHGVTFLKWFRATLSDIIVVPLFVQFISCCFELRSRIHIKRALFMQNARFLRALSCQWYAKWVCKKAHTLHREPKYRWFFSLRAASVGFISLPFCWNLKYVTSIWDAPFICNTLYEPCFTTTRKNDSLLGIYIEILLFSGNMLHELFAIVYTLFLCFVFFFCCECVYLHFCRAADSACVASRIAY